MTNEASTTKAEREAMRRQPELAEWSAMDCTCDEHFDCDRCAYLEDVGDDYIDKNGAVGVALLLAEVERLRTNLKPLVKYLSYSTETSPPEYAEAVRFLREEL